MDDEKQGRKMHDGVAEYFPNKGGEMLIQPPMIF